MIAVLFGLAFVIGSGCVFNNLIDRKIDKKMERTEKRALVTGEISVKNAVIFAVVLLLLGILLLSYANILTVGVAILEHFFYVVIYGIFKRRSVHGTLVGSISGAVPPVIGYVAVTNTLDLAAAILFLILVFWQMPHFYSIAIYRKKDYASAGIPVLPIVNGITATKKQIVFYVIAFTFASLSLVTFEYKGLFYGVGMIVVGTLWLYEGVKGLSLSDSEKWAKKMFGFSLLALLVWSVLVSI